ncbi:MAG: pilin, partial [Patescibacteria group bacterium]
SYLNKFLGAQTALAQGNQLEYEPLVPLPGLFNAATGDYKISDFSTYVMAMFRFLIGAAAVLAVIMIIIGGLEYMTTDVISNKSAGKEKINQAIIGLLLAIGSWLILNTIDPNILTTTLDPSTTPAPPTNN